MLSKKLLIVQAIVFALFIVAVILLGQYVDVASELRQAVLAFGVLGWVAFILVYVTGTVLLIPGTIFTVFGGLIYGLWVGFALNMLGASLGALAAYYVSRALGQQAFVGLAPKRILLAEEHLTKRPFESVLMLRLIPLIPYNALNYILGVTRIPVRPYWWATVLGIAPTSFAYTYAAVKVGEVVSEKGLSALSSQDLLSLAPVFLLVLVLAVLPFFIKRIRARQH